MFLSCSRTDDVLKAIKTKNVEMIDLRFTDLPGHLAAFFRPAKRSVRPQNPTGLKTTIDYSARD